MAPTRSAARPSLLLHRTAAIPLLLIACVLLYTTLPQHAANRLLLSSKLSPSLQGYGGIEAPLRLEGRAAPVPALTIQQQQVVVRTFNDGSGGPHCLAQLAYNLRHVLGLPRTAITTTVPHWDTWYTQGLPATEPVRGPGSGPRVPPPAPFPGTVWWNHEFHDQRLDTSSGVKQVIWELGDVPLQPLHRGSKWVGHTFYTRDFLRLPRRSMVRPYVNPAQWPDLPSSPAAVAPYKSNLVLVDDELDPLPDLIRRLGDRYSDLEVVVVQGFNRSSMIELFKRAKVYVDASMRGAERVGQEASLYYVVPVLELARNGRPEYDYATHPALKWVADRDGARHRGGAYVNEGEDLVARVDAVLADWEGSVGKMMAARALVLAHPRLHAIDLSRLLAVTAHTHVLACEGAETRTGDGAAARQVAESKQANVAQAAVLLASALHFLHPLSSSTLHTTGEASVLEGAARDTLMAATGDVAGVLAYTTVRDRSALCKAQGAGAQEAAAALSAAHFGNGPVAVVLSWRALPLLPAAIQRWQAALLDPSAPSPVSIITIRGVALGIMVRLGQGQGGAVTAPPVRPVLEAGGAIRLEGLDGTAPPPMSWPAEAQPGEWADLRRLEHPALGPASIPSIRGVEVDEAVMDQVAVLQEAGIDVLHPATGLPGHGDVLRLYRGLTKASAYLCGQVDFRRVAGKTRYLHALCEGAVVAPA